MPLIRDENGRPVFLQGIAFDITHLKQAALAEEAKLAAQAANSAKSEFLAQSSHEIRTPLNGVVGMIDLLRSTNLNGNQHRYAQLARDSADALLGVINDILDFSKIEAGKVEIERIEFDLQKLIEDLTELLAPLAKIKHLALGCFLPPKLPRRLIGDPNRIRQVLTNLVNNALKFTSRGSVIMRTTLLRNTAQEASVRIEVQDTGIGIPADRLDRLFKSFSQVDSSTTRKYGGTGLGLAISKRLVETHGRRNGHHQRRGHWDHILVYPASGSGRGSGAGCFRPGAVRCAGILVVESDPTYRHIVAEPLQSCFSQSSATVDFDGRP